jgi:hypothetical protein
MINIILNKHYCSVCNLNLLEDIYSNTIRDYRKICYLCNNISNILNMYDKHLIKLKILLNDEFMKINYNGEQINLRKCSCCKLILSKDIYFYKITDTICKQCNLQIYKCPHGNQCKTRCRHCLGHTININRCSRCKKKFIPIDNDSIKYMNKPLQTCNECRYKTVCNHGQLRKSKCNLCINETHNIYQINNKCLHKKRKSNCKICDFKSYLANIVRGQVNSALKANKSKKSIEYLGCDITTFKAHIEQGFTEENGFTWDNYGSYWHIDHITPLKYEEPSLEELFERLHFTNTQPLLATDNISKGNRFIG